MLAKMMEAFHWLFGLYYPQIWMAQRVASANQLQEVTNLYIYIPFLVHFLVFTKINMMFSIAKNIPWNVGIPLIIQHSEIILLHTNTEKCLSASNHITQGWKLPSCTLRSSEPQCSCFLQAMLNICQCSYKVVLQTDLIRPRWEILADPYSVGLPSIVVVAYHSVLALLSLKPHKSMQSFLHNMCACPSA